MNHKFELNVHAPTFEDLCTSSDFNIYNERVTSLSNCIPIPSSHNSSSTSPSQSLSIRSSMFIRDSVQS